MKVTVCFLVLLTLAYATCGQKRWVSYTMDTIHLTGYVYYVNGKPAVGERIFSKQFHRVNPGKPGSAVTIDSVGYFQFKGTAFNDTLFIANGNNGYLYFYNRGSRHMQIYLPSISPTALETRLFPVVAKRNGAKPEPVRIRYEVDDNDIVFVCGFIDQPALYPGGIDKFQRYIFTRLKYPQLAINQHIEGTVRVRFTIARDGSPTNVAVIQGIGYGCDEAVADIIRKSPKWRPAVINGDAQATDFTISVPFILED